MMLNLCNTKKESLKLQVSTTNSFSNSWLCWTRGEKNSTIKTQGTPTKILRGSTSRWITAATSRLSMRSPRSWLSQINKLKLQISLPNRTQWRRCTGRRRACL